MNILIVTQYFYPENFRINDLALELKKKVIKYVYLLENRIIQKVNTSKGILLKAMMTKNGMV